MRRGSEFRQVTAEPRHEPRAEARVRAESQEARREAQTRAPQDSLSADERAVLARGGIELPTLALQPSPAVERTIARFAALLATSRSVGAVAALLGVDESRVRQRLAARTLYGIKRGLEW